MSTEELHDFVEASNLSELNAMSFASRLTVFDPPEEGVHPFFGVAPLEPLAPVNDQLQRTFAARRSGRRFDDSRLSAPAVERLLAAVGSGNEGRLVPSAGGLSAVHTFGFGMCVAGPTDGQVFRYAADSHAIQSITTAPLADEVRRLFQLDCDGMPQIVLVFVADTRLVLTKYGNRGGRFVLQEAGHAAQNVGLRLAHDRLTGYVLGGAMDREVLSVLGLAHTQAMVAGAMACGCDGARRRRIRR